MSPAQQPATNKPAPASSARIGASLLMAIDSVPETRGLGVRLASEKGISTLRGCPAEEPYVLIELRPPVSGGQTPPSVSVGKEWANLALNLGGATLSWVGVAGSAAVAPETGGLSLAGVALLWTGAVASSVQVGNSIFRLGAIYTGHSSTVEQADEIRAYTVITDLLDVAGIAGAGGAFKEAAAADKALGRAGFSTYDALKGGALSRPIRRRLTEALALQGAKRVAAAKITLIVRLKLLDAFAAAYGLSSSAYTGAIHDVVVFIVHPGQS